MRRHKTFVFFCLNTCRSSNDLVPWNSWRAVDAAVSQHQHTTRWKADNRIFSVCWARPLTPNTLRGGVDLSHRPPRGKRNEIKGRHSDENGLTSRSLLPSSRLHHERPHIRVGWEGSRAGGWRPDATSVHTERGEGPALLHQTLQHRWVGPRWNNGCRCLCSTS